MHISISIWKMEFPHYQVCIGFLLIKKSMHWVSYKLFVFGTENTLILTFCRSKSARETINQVMMSRYILVPSIFFACLKIHRLLCYFILPVFDYSFLYCIQPLPYIEHSASTTSI